MKLRNCLCPICGEPFTPHPRNAKGNCRQKTCGKPYCRQEWQRRRRRGWNKLNPGGAKCLESRRAKNRAWAKAYPDYWRHRYQTHPEYVERDKRRRVAARRKAKVSAKRTPLPQVLIEKLHALDSCQPAKVSSKRTPSFRRVEAIEDCLRSTVEVLWSAKRTPIGAAAVSAG